MVDYISAEEQSQINRWLSPRVKGLRGDEIRPTYYEDRYKELMIDRLDGSCG